MCSFVPNSLVALLPSEPVRPLIAKFKQYLPEKLFRVNRLRTIPGGSPFLEIGGERPRLIERTGCLKGRFVW